MKFSLELPDPYRPQEVLGFHSRDLERFAEDHASDRLRKGFLLDGTPIVLDISFQERQALCSIQADGRLTAGLRKQLPAIAAGLIGLNHDATDFEKLHARDKLLGPLVRKRKGLRIPQTSTPFEALTWAIIGQQINLSFAVTLRRTLIGLAGRRHSTGLWCYPEAVAVADLKAEDLTSRKFSGAKAETIIRVAQMSASGDLVLDTNRPDDLLAIKGVGPWTVNYVLMRGMAAADCSLHGDAGIKAALRPLLGTAPTSDEAFRILEKYRPYRSWAAAHLWASL